MKIKVSDFIAKYLSQKYGVSKVFMVSGGGAMHLNNSFAKYIPYLCNHHEQACAFAAEGYSRAGDKLAVVNVTTGPGGLNCMNGLFGQWTDSVPVLYISGQVKFQTCKSSCPELNLRQLGDQEVDIISAVKHLTKYSVMIKEPNDIKYHLDKAIYLATHGRKGPVWLDIPMNVQAALIEDDCLKSFIAPLYDENASDSISYTILDKISNAKKPLFIAGHGIRLSNQIENFKKLIHKLHIPTVLTFNGCDLLNTSDELNVGKIGTIGQRAGNFALQNADLVICLGTRNNIRQVSYNWENFAKKAYKIIIDIDQAELEKPLVKPDLAIHADLASVIPSLLKVVNENNISTANSEWNSYCYSLKNEFSFDNTPEYHQKEFQKINPYHFTRLLTEKLNSNDALVIANATPSICVFQNGVFNGQRVLMNSGDASMGFGLPAAVGVASLGKYKRTICLEGDGSIMMNIQELQTISFNKLPVTIFVYKNNGYSSIRQTQRNFFNGFFAGCSESSGVSVPDFISVAEAFGIKTVKISSSEHLNDVLDFILCSKAPILCEVELEDDYVFVPKLSSRTLPDGTMVSPSLEDMYPFIPREQFSRLMNI